MTKPNILFIMSDDHAAHAISAYGSRINSTPNIDRLADEGVKFTNCFCTNSICAPSRATILTGLYSHLNGVRTLEDRLDRNMLTFPSLLRASGYQTGIIGKWHLGHGPRWDPAGFDDWMILPGQGEYFDPPIYVKGREQVFPGYVTDILTDLAVKWLGARDTTKPFFLMLHHKAPHRPWEPHPRHRHLYEGVDIPQPDTFDDDYATRIAAEAAQMRIDRDLTFRDLKANPPTGLTSAQQKSWKYQRYIKDYLRCVAAIDESVGTVLDFLDTSGLAENTLVIYTSDQGFFLGDHGWYDKRLMYEESLRMPFLLRYPSMVKTPVVCDPMITNVDFAPTFLDLAGVATPETFQGRSLLPLLQGEIPQDWPTAMYYRYWMHMDEYHKVWAHLGIRTLRHKLIYYYGEALGTTASEDVPTPKSWELFDLEKDPMELRNVFADPAYAMVAKALKAELKKLQVSLGDTDPDASD